MTKSILGMKGFILLIYPYHSPVREAKAELKPARNPKVGADELTMKGCGFLT